MDEEDIMHRIEADSRRRTEEVRQMIAEAGRPDILAEFDANMRDIRLGIHGARATWHALSPAQRRLLEAMGTGRRLVRSRHFRSPRYDAYGEPHAVDNIAGVATVRNLASRELIAWDGGAFDPEARAILTERGRFVLKHGRAA